MPCGLDGQLWPGVFRSACCRRLCSADVPPTLQAQAARNMVEDALPEHWRMLLPAEEEAGHLAVLLRPRGSRSEKRSEG